MSFLSTLAQTTSEFNFESFDPSVYSTTTTTESAATAGVGIAMLLFLTLLYGAILVVIVVSMWKLFKKAGKEGWAALIPIYNTVVLLQIIGRPVWWILLMLIPFVNFVVAIIVGLDLAKSFGKDAGIGILVALLPLIGYPILAFGDAKYQGPAVSGSDPATPAQTPAV